MAKTKSRERARAKRAPWTPFQEIDEVFNHSTGENGPPVDARTAFVNSRYLVTLQDWHVDHFLRHKDGSKPEPGVRLSIKRVHGGPADDWRDLQRIKNELVGSEREAVQVFPAEGRLVDTADQAWLWVLPEGFAYPIGFFDGRLVAEGRAAHGRKGTQRPFEVRPPDCLSAEEFDEIKVEAREKALPITWSHTDRGFRLGEFVDLYDVPASIQKSSLARTDAIWLGGEDRMHLDQRQARELAHLLLRFAEEGELPEEA